MVHRYRTPSTTVRRHIAQRYRQGARAIAATAPKSSFVVLTLLSALGMATLTTALWLALIQILPY